MGGLSGVSTWGETEGGWAVWCFCMGRDWRWVGCLVFLHGERLKVGGLSGVSAWGETGVGGLSGVSTWGETEGGWAVWCFRVGRD